MSLWTAFKLSARNLRSKFKKQIDNLGNFTEEELKNSKNNVEYKEYASELLYGKYRNMDKVYKNLKKVGVDTNKI